MDRVKLDRFGRVLIPKKVRERLGLTAGAELDLEVEGDRLVLNPEAGDIVVQEGQLLVFDVEGQDDIRAAIERQRAERNARILFGTRDD